MYTITHKPHVSYPVLFRWCAGAMGAALVVNWVGLLIIEAARNRVMVPNIYSFPQAINLAVIFGGYALGCARSWREVC